MAKKLRVGFCGSGPFASLCLELISEHMKPEWVVTNMPRHSGRGMSLHSTPVGETSQRLGITCFTTDKFSVDEERIEWIMHDSPDVILVIDFGHIVKEPILSLPRLGCLNIHPSKLPKYRGAAPVQRAIMDGLDTTAVTIFKLDHGMDTGPILSQTPVVIATADDSNTLLRKCAAIGVKELIRHLCEIDENEWIFTPQTISGGSLAPKINKSEGRIDWHKTAKIISSLVRAIGETPGAYCMVNDKRFRIHKVEIYDLAGEPGTILQLDNGYPIIACGDGALKLLSVQQEGKKVQSGSDWFRGSRLTAGAEFK